MARAVLADANQTHGYRFHVISPLKGGLQAGMWLLADAEGEPAVLKWNPNRHWAPQVMRAADAVARIRAAGYPTPAWYAAGISGFGYAYQIQEFVTGATASNTPARLHVC